MDFMVEYSDRLLESIDGKKILLEARGPRPDIVVTNYSMLEYMLCRPQDQCFFGPELRVVILDEAHLYTGTLAAEIALLLRRLYQRCGVDPDKVLQIATSATLGGTTDELAAFTANLFTIGKKWVRAIVGEKTRPPLAKTIPPDTNPTSKQLAGDPWLSGATLQPDPDGRNQFIRHIKACQRLAERLPGLTAAPMPSGEDRPAVLLANTLQHAPLIHRLQEILFFAREQRKSDGLKLLDLARELWGNDEQTAQHATMQLLQLAAVARHQPGSYPIVPHRLHILARPTTGLSVCLDPDCSGPDENKLSPFGCVTPGSADTCPHCRKRLLPLCACRNCGEWLLMGEKEENQYRPPRPGTTKTDHLSPALDRVRDRLAADKPVFLTLGPDGKRGGVAELGIQVAVVTRCPNCRTTSRRFDPFAKTSPLPLSILAEAVLAGMPVYPSPANVYLPAQGRRLLAFSDSRQEAARLGPRLTAQHDEQVIRALTVEVLGEEAGIADVAGLESALQLLEGQIAANANLRPFLEGQIKQLREQVAASRGGGRVDYWEKKLAARATLAQLLDPVSGERHRAVFETNQGSRVWDQRDWEANREKIAQQTFDLLAEEFAVARVNSISAEKLGLAEVVYPGLEVWVPPPSLVGTLPSPVSSELVDCWPVVLASLLDTLRIDGAITLGSKERDEKVEIAGFSLGRYAAREAEGYLMRRFIGERSDQRRRQFATDVLRQAGIADAKQADELARDVRVPYSISSFKKHRMAGHRGSTSIYSAKLRMDNLSRRFD